MERIRIGTSDQLYDIISIMPASQNIMKIQFDSIIPIAWGDITTYTVGGMEGGTIAGYDTVWKQDGQTVYLSNDGSVYVPPAPPEPAIPPEPYVPTLAEVQSAKKQGVSAACEQIIYDGINVTLTDGSIGHYSLTIEDQLNLFGKLSQISSGAQQLEYHADGQPCQYYTAADMQTIIQASMWHVSYHTTYCNAINMWISGCQNIDELQTIFYGAEVPEQYRSNVLNAYLLEIASMAGGGDDSTDLS